VRLRALDLFCGGGGASDGLANAGFEVVGVDMRRPSRSYPHAFIQADVAALEIDLSEWDFIWASPPCQRHSIASRSHRDYTPEKYPCFIDVVREKLAGHPFTCIENVSLAPIRPDLVLTGPSVNLHRIERKRHFELSFFCLGPSAPRLARSAFASDRAVTVTTSLSSKNHFYPRKRIGLPGRVSPAEACEAMGITRSMTAREVGNAIPPAYAEFIARQALAQGCGARILGACA
jgi:DNA (cytosine-5)-methyltransferase 1